MGDIRKPDNLYRPMKKSPTNGMNMAQRILHVGGRNNAAGYIEFGSIQAVEALVLQVLRDTSTTTKLSTYVPPGYKLVPTEPTEEMLWALMQWDSDSGFSILPEYRAMLDAVPN